MSYDSSRDPLRGLAASLSSPTRFMSRVTPSDSDELPVYAKALWVFVPEEVSGGVATVRLTPVGADDATFAAIRPVLEGYCENIFHVGGPGAGHVIKLLNNFVAQAICTATAEAFAVGVRAGVDPRKLVEVVSAGAVNSGIFQAMAKTLSGDLEGLKFELDNARKDVRYYTHLAEGLTVPSIVGEAVHQSLAMASAMGQGKKFVPALVLAQEQLTGAKITPN